MEGTREPKTKVRERATRRVGRAHSSSSAVSSSHADESATGGGAILSRTPTSDDLLELGPRFSLTISDLMMKVAKNENLTKIGSYEDALRIISLI